MSGAYINNADELELSVRFIHACPHDPEDCRKNECGFNRNPDEDIHGTAAPQEIYWSEEEDDVVCPEYET